MYATALTSPLIVQMLVLKICHGTETWGLLTVLLIYYNGIKNPIPLQGILHNSLLSKLLSNQMYYTFIKTSGPITNFLPITKMSYCMG